MQPCGLPEQLHGEFPWSCFQTTATFLLLFDRELRVWGHLGEGGRRDPELGRELQHQPAGLVQRESSFIDNLLVRIHLIIVMISVDRPCAMGV